jgi:methylation protein EvaC
MTTMAVCLICEEPFEPFMSFGRMPIANGFLTPAEYEDEFFSELTVGNCPRCSMVQLGEILPPEKLFHENYAYFSSISTRMTEHFRRFAEWVTASFLGGKDRFVVEIGSNDGIMLQNFAKAGVRHLGVEPSANVAQAARDRGVRTVCCFFDERAGREIRAEHGAAQAVLGANVICHLPDIHSVIRGLLELMDERGVFVLREVFYHPTSDVVDHSRMQSLVLQEDEFARMKDQVLRQFEGKAEFLFADVPTLERYTAKMRVDSLR